MADYAGTQIGRYLIQERIGTGGMARVFKAQDTSLERTVAVKILHEHLADDSNFKERFEREAKLVASLNHPNIVQVYDFDVIDRQGFPVCYMVMPFIQGRTLRQELEETALSGTRLPNERILQRMLDLSAALGYAHTNGMVHRDVKPGNVIINADDRAILTDFGIARLVASTRLTQDGVSTGTPIYMSPEQANGAPGDSRSDLYALGVILFEMLAGRPPFDDPSGLSVMVKHLTAPVPRLSELGVDVSPEVDRVLSRALAKDPDERFQSAEAFAEAIQEVLKPARTPANVIETEKASPPQERSPVTNSGSSRFRYAVAVSVIILILITVAALAVRPNGEEIAQADTNNAVAPNNAIRPITADMYFTSTFSEDDPTLGNWPQGNVAGLLQQTTSDGFYRFRSERRQTASTSILAADYTYGSASISLTGRLEEESSETGAFGIVFRYVDEDHYYVFAVDGRGRYSVWVRNDGEWTELRDEDEQWTRNENILPLGETNTLLVSLMGNTITGYVNGERVVRVQDSTIQNGKIGLYVATPTEGITSALIDQYQVFPVASPSMTGN